jgi:hypothetical protein
MPPAPMSATGLPRKALAKLRSTPVDRVNKGRPESPPVSLFAEPCSEFGRSIVVFEMINPSIWWASASAAMSAMAESSRSGATFKNIGF